MVRVRAVQEPALLRWFARGDGVVAEEGGGDRGQNRGLVRLQAFRNDAFLRWDAWQAGLRKSR